jgi:hypothetical protein
MPLERDEVEYASTVTLSEVPGRFAENFKLVVTQAILIWLFALPGLLIVLFRSRIRVHAPFILGFLVFSFLSVCPRFYFREHYFILFFPAGAVVADAGFDGFLNLVGGAIQDFGGASLSHLLVWLSLAFICFSSDYISFIFHQRMSAVCFTGAIPFLNRSKLPNT